MNEEKETMFEILLKDLVKPKLPATFRVGEDLKKGERCEITLKGFVVPIMSEARKREIIKQCLKYCLHRKRNHEIECGLSISVEEIEKVLDK